MGDRFISIGGIGDGSSWTSGAIYTDLSNQSDLAAGTKPRVMLEVSDTADHYVPMVAPGVDSSANQAPFAVLTSTAGVDGDELVIEGRYRDGRPGMAQFRSQRIYPYTTDNNNYLSGKARRASPSRPAM
jgi:hypothetical protein